MLVTHNHKASVSFDAIKGLRVQLESTPSQSLDFVIVISSLSDLLAEYMRMTMLTLMTDGAHTPP